MVDDQVSFPTLKNRIDLADMLQHRSVRFGAEVGVWKGGYSEVLLQRTGVEVLYCIDAWDGTGMSQEFNGAAIMEEALVRLRTYGDRVQVMRGKSVDMAGHIRDGRLDFVYIDADHSFEGCTADVKAYVHKLRSGGVLCGHDYCNRRGKGVKRAVDELFGIRVKHTEERCPSWWVIIP